MELSGIRKFSSLFYLIACALLLAGCTGGGDSFGHWLSPAPIIAPTVTAVVPLNDAADVAINSKVIATFSKAMDVSSINTSSFKLVDNIGIPVAGTVTYVVASRVGTFTPNAPLAPNTRYTATITTVARDLDGNALAVSFAWAFTTGALPDTIAPRVIATINANGAVNVPINTQVGATFSEPMDPLTLTTTTFTLSTGGIPVPGLVTYAGVNAVFAPTNTLLPNTLYNVRITTGAQDLAGNGLTVDSTLSWTTGAAPDTLAPTVTHIVPANLATGVSISLQTIAATFSEPMDPATITNLTFSVKETISGNNVPGTLVYDLILLSNIATFKPTFNLAPNTQFTATITTATEDLAGNALAGNFTWTFTTGAVPDTVAPRVIATINANGAINVPINTQVGATFSESMDPLTLTTTTFTVSTGGVPVPGAVTYAGVNAVFAPTNTLLPNTLYNVRITTGAKDLAGNGLAVDSTLSWTTGAAPDTIAPTVNLVVPANLATGVSVSLQTIAATFSEPMDPATITNLTFSVKETISGNNVPGTLVYDLILLSNIATFKPTFNLAASTQFTATITTAAEDLAGNALAGNFAWIFTTGALPDTIAPRVIATINANGAVNVPINTQVGATFSESMDPLTLTTTTFTLATGGVPVPGAVTYAGVNAVFAPTNTLLPNTLYNVRITTGAKDLAGNGLTVDSTLSWTTGAAPDTIAPTVNLVVPANLATGVSVSLQTIAATFSEPMDPATITNLTFSVKETASGNNVPGTLVYDLILLSNIATFKPTFNLAPSTQFTATITTAAKDLAGNALAGNFAWTFTTGALPDTIAPRVIATINANGAVNVPINTQVGATFSESMDPLTLTTTTFTLSTGGVPVPGAVTYAGVNAVFAPAGLLLPNTLYNVRITTGAKDLAGNGLAVDSTLSWTTGPAPDVTAPMVNLVVPADSATNVSISIQTIAATFSEPMDPATITNLTFSVKETISGNNVPGTLVYDLILLSNIATFKPTSNLAPNTQFTATITTAAKDLAGNALASPFVWIFTTGAVPDIIAPRIIATINANGDVNVPINTQVGATLSEPMDPLTITTTTFTLATGGVPVPGTVTYAGVNAVFAPSSLLAGNTLYTATITTEAKDLAGNGLAVDSTWSWTTGAVPDIVLPTVTLVSPADLAVNVPLNKSISATFSEPMDPATITNLTFSVKETISGNNVPGTMVYDLILLSNIATFNPTANFTANTQYTATITTAAKDLAGNALAGNKVWSFTTGILTSAAAVSLGTAAPFAGFGGAAGMTNTGVFTEINGDIGTTGASTLMTGFQDSVGDIYTVTAPNDGMVTGRVYTAAPAPGGAGVGGNDTTFAIATQARADANTAFTNLSAAMLPGGIDPGAGQLGGLTLAPGIYKAAGNAFLITGADLTLDAGGDVDAVFVFQMGTSLTVGAAGAPRSVLLINGAQAKNVFWQVGSAATINAAGGGTMVGTIISSAGTTFSTAGNVAVVTLNGRALALNASVTMVNTVINVPPL